MKTLPAFLRCLTFLSMVLTASLVAANISYAQTVEPPPGMFMLMPNHVWIIISPIDAHVRYMITDPDGLRVGDDPRTNEDYDEFVASGGYASTSLIPSHQDQFQREIEFNLKDGTYTIEMIGTGLTEYGITILLNRSTDGITRDGRTSKEVSFDSVTDKDLSSKFQFTYASDPTKPIGTATRLSDPAGLKQDIIVARKIGWIKNDGIETSFLKKAEAIEASIASGNKTAAKNQIEAFINEVEAYVKSQPLNEYGRRDPHDDETLLREMLIQDAEAIRDGL